MNCSIVFNFDFVFYLINVLTMILFLQACGNLVMDTSYRHAVFNTPTFKALSRGAIFHATCSAILQLRDVN